MQDRLKCLLVTAPLAAACSNADFKSQSATKAQPERAVTRCTADRHYTDESLSLKVKGGKDVELFVEGEMCPRAPAELAVVFVVDFSLSMYNKEKSRGNDQVVGGSCGRLAGAKAVVDQYAKSLDPDTTETSVGVVQFASNLVGTIPLTKIADFPAKATVDAFCQGIDGTNYKAGFEAAAVMLAKASGTKVLYLITDGLPTEGGGGARENAPRHRDAALAAVEALKASVPNTLVNVVFLGDPNDTEGLDFKPLDFLTQLTGDPARAKLASKADDLAKEILKLEPPVIELATDTAQATIAAADGSNPTPVAFAEFKPKADAPQVWTFRTVPFKAYPGASATADLASRLSIVAKDDKGEPYQAAFKISPAPASTP